MGQRKYLQFFIRQYESVLRVKVHNSILKKDVFMKFSTQACLAIVLRVTQFQNYNNPIQYGCHKTTCLENFLVKTTPTLLYCFTTLYMSTTGLKKYTHYNEINTA